jgi:uncharacterized protein
MKEPMNNKQTRPRSHPDQSLWAISVAEVGRRPGQSQEVETTLPAPEGIGDEFYGVTPGSPVEVDAVIDSLADGLILSGAITATFSGECSRCLTAISEERTTHIDAYFPYDTAEDYRAKDYKGEAEIIAESDEESQDTYPLSPDGNFADFEALIRDNLTDLIPAQALCKEDCLGLCPQCGLNLNENPDHQHEIHDIRWAALEDFSA